MDNTPRTMLLLLLLAVTCLAAFPPFDSQWVRSDKDTVNLTVINSTTLRWTKPHKPHVVMTFLPQATSIAKPGETFRLSFAWRSDGQNKCDPFDWEDGKTCSCGQKLKEKCEGDKGTPTCARTSVNCIEGTGDFRIALWDTGGSAAPKDDFCHDAGGPEMHACMDKIGGHYKEYQFRTMPHVSTTYFHPRDSEPGGFFAKNTKYAGKAFCDSRLPGHWGNKQNSGVFPGFAAPRGKFVAMELVVARVAERTYNVSISMGPARYEYQHTWLDQDAALMPQSIDAMGIWFANSRSYDYVEMR